MKSKGLVSVDMTYPSGIIPPDVMLLLDQVKKDSEDIPEKLLYTSRFGNIYLFSDQGHFILIYKQQDRALMFSLNFAWIFKVFFHLTKKIIL